MVGSTLSNEVPEPSKWDRTTCDGTAGRSRSLLAAATAGTGRIFLVVYGDFTGTIQREEKPVDWAAELKKVAAEAKMYEDVMLSLCEKIVPDLSFLYRPPIKHKAVYKRLRHHIHQPCWRRGRWKSLT